MRLKTQNESFQLNLKNIYNASRQVMLAVRNVAGPVVIKHKAKYLSTFTNNLCVRLLNTILINFYSYITLLLQ